MIFRYYYIFLFFQIYKKIFKHLIINLSHTSYQLMYQLYNKTEESKIDKQNIYEFVSISFSL